MTDRAMFYPLFEILQEKQIYCPKINDADIYLNFIESNQDNDEVENAYQEFTQLYDKNNFDWLYYYIYIILLNDSCELIIDEDLYEKIVANTIAIYKKKNKKMRI